MVPNMRSTISLALIISTLLTLAPPAPQNQPALAQSPSWNGIFPPVLCISLKANHKGLSGKGGQSAASDIDTILLNQQQTKAITDFLVYAESALDRGGHPGDPASDCAYLNLLAWARAGALLQDAVPYSTASNVERMFKTPAFNVLTLKFEDAGYKLTPEVLAWLKALNHKSIDWCGRASVTGNQKVWCGAMAALYCLIQPDQKALKFQDEVWRDSIASIGDDGVIESELGRGQMVLIYHNLWLSGVLMMRAARQSMGQYSGAEKNARIKLVADFIGKELCDHSELLRRAKVSALYKQPHIYERMFPSTIKVFGSDLFNSDWDSCARRDIEYFNSDVGGDLRKTRDVLTVQYRQRRH